MFTKLLFSLFIAASITLSVSEKVYSQTGGFGSEPVVANLGGTDAQIDHSSQDRTRSDICANASKTWKFKSVSGLGEAGDNLSKDALDRIRWKFYCNGTVTGREILSSKEFSYRWSYDSSENSFMIEGQKMRAFGITKSYMSFTSPDGKVRYELIPE